MRRSTSIAALVGAACLVLPATAAAGGAESPQPGLTPGRVPSGEQGTKADPDRVRGPNPYLALLPDPSRADYAGWKRKLAAESDQRQRSLFGDHDDDPQPVLVDEDEPAGSRGGNDTPSTAQEVPGFGTGWHDNPRARLLGQLSPEQVPAEEVEPSEEDDGSISLAAETGIDAARDGIATTGEIGDGPHGSAGSGSGDVDVYALTADGGTTVTVDITTPAGGETGLDSTIEAYDEGGALLAGNDDDGSTFDSYLQFDVPSAGTYYVMIGSFGTFPEDPFDSGSGTGVGTQGGYDLSVTAGESDVDYYAVDLRKGDVLAATVGDAASQLAIYDPEETLVQGSTFDGSGIYPSESPLPGGGTALADHVASVSGTHYLAVGNGDGKYDLTTEVYRPGTEGERKPQTIFIDFDGERVNTAPFGGPGVRDLSPLRAFLGKWGLTRTDEEALMEQIVETAAENLRTDLMFEGNNPRFRLDIDNSADDPDDFGEDNVSRVIVGGTIDESGVPTIGIAESIDPGNFGHEETALLLLDILSGPNDDPASLNHYLTEDSDRVKFVGTAIGNIVAHEAGHYLGGWHTDPGNEQVNLMDSGGDLEGMFAVGPDRIGGTADDIDTDSEVDPTIRSRGSRASRTR